LLVHFLEEAAESLNKKIPTPSFEISTLLATHHFPGNVREFKAIVYDAVARHKSGLMSVDSFKEIVGKELSTSGVSLSPPKEGGNMLVDVFGRFPTLKDAENFLIEEALRLSRNNQGMAASLLGITRQALNKRLIRKKQEQNKL
jgi:DNA-binding NtrC family response regulator